MLPCDFNNINVVPIGNEFFDHQTPNLLRKGFKIDRLRQFYTRDVKNTELSFRGKLSTIIDEFPRLDEIHPLYSDLLRLNFDREQYKLALGQVNTARHLITKIADDYVTLIKFGESLKQCKALKVSAVSRMFSVIDEITPSLAYLEQIRTKIVRLPSIDPNSPSLLICGYPNVDKTCFMNRITKSVNFDVGHIDYKDLRYQVIDAPVILDKPVFGDCNVVVTALACHLRAALVLFFMDVSGSCGYSIAHQAVLLHSFMSLFVNNPLVIVCDETDLMQISEQDWRLIEQMNSGMGANEEVGLIITNLRTEEGVISVKNAACERLLDRREGLSCIAQTKAKILSNKYNLAHQEWKQDMMTPQNLDDDDKVSDLLLDDSDVLFRLEELKREKGLKQADEDEEDDFVMAEERFTEEHKDQVVDIRKNKNQPLRILIALAFFFLVGNTYGVIQQCLSPLNF